MKAEDYEQQQASAERLADYAVEGDGKAVGNAELVMRVVDGFLGVPCSMTDQNAARAIRKEWAQMKKNGTDWSTWPAKDLHRLEQILSAMIDTLSNAHGVTVACFIQQALRRK